MSDVPRPSTDECADGSVGDDEEPSIALLLGGGRNQRLLGDRLDQQYDVVRVGPEGFDDAVFDLCIVDTPRFVEHRSMLEARKKAAEPLVLPYLLVTRRDLDTLPPDVWTDVDDVITAPIAVPELEPRIESLLELRTLSLRLRQQRRLEEVASVISHDLRSPLEVVKGNLDLAAETGDSEYFELMAVALDRMDDLISDVLTLARQGSDELDLSPVSLARTVREVWETTDTGDADLDLAVDEDDAVFADERRLRQLLANLLTNANEHNPGHVTVRVGDLPDGFFVEDDGTGLPETVGREVLETGVSTDDTGTGLGLAIVQRTADAHGWDMSLIETDTGGLRFEFGDVPRPASLDGDHDATGGDVVEGEGP